eukprot:Gb_30684 [translate_table: standard]
MPNDFEAARDSNNDRLSKNRDPRGGFHVKGQDSRFIRHKIQCKIIQLGIQNLDEVEETYLVIAPNNFIPLIELVEIFSNSGCRLLQIHAKMQQQAMDERIDEL